MQKRRRDSVCGSWKGPETCDEYPFASTYEGSAAGLSTLGRSASTFPVPSQEQNIEGGTIRSFYRANRLQDGDKYVVVVRYSGPLPGPVPVPLPVPGIGEPEPELEPALDPS